MTFIRQSLLAILATWAGAVPGDRPRLAHFPPTEGRYTVVVLKVIDGDTLEVGHLTPQRIRLQGIDAPELNTAEGKEAAAFLKQHLPEGLMTTCELSGKKTFERIVGDIECKNGFWAAKQMLENGQAKRVDTK